METLFTQQNVTRKNLQNLATKLLLILILVFNSTNVHTQSCPNVDFAMGNFTNWQGRTGTCCPINLPVVGFAATRHTIIGAPGTDPNTGGALVLPAPGFARVARLGNANNGAEAEGLSYTFLVDPTSALFIYTYAVVLEDPGHSPAEQPRFELQVRDQFNNIIPCTFYEVAAGAGIPGFQTFGSVVWCNWTQVGVDLSAYLGQTVTIEARTGDCDLGGHFGYAYLVGQCQPLTINMNFCAGSTTANLSAPGGFASYLWSTGETTQNITINNPTVGQNVTCTVTSVTGCQAVINATLTPVTVNTSISAQTNVSCYGGNNGSATVNASGTAGPYTYNWTPSGGTNPTATNLTAGNYTVTVTDVNTGCTSTTMTTITQPTFPLTVNGNVTNVACYGNATGAIDITASGGTAPYSYSWSSGSTTEDVSSLPAGNYNVAITDAMGCVVTQPFTITQPASPMVISGTSTNVSCSGGNNGTIDITVSGGTSGYTYYWNNGALTQDNVGLAAGNYSVIVTDANGCTNNTYNVTIAEPSAALSATGVVNNAICFGGNTGSIDLTPLGGTPPYSYLWSNGATTQDLNFLSSGTYNLNLTDANGCTYALYSATISQPSSSITVSSVNTDVLCYNGSNGAIDLTVSGGTPGYTYNWNTGATTQDLSGLSASGYAVTVIDANGCSTNYNTTINQPTAAVTINGSITHVNCFGGNTGNITLTVTGGVGPYTYIWSNGAITQNISNLTAGNYNVVVTDANGCTSTFATTITQPGAGLSAVGVPYHNICFGAAAGSVDITPLGGVPGYSYQWSNGATTQDINGLTAGNYSVIITDANGCSYSGYNVTITEPTQIIVTGTVTDINCYGANNGAIDVTVSGGNPPYNYAWSNGANTEDINGLVPGLYTLNLYDANGCVNNTFNATVNQPATGVSVSALANNIPCFGGYTGSIDLSTTGGAAPYSYLWNNGATSQDLSGLSAGTYSVVVTDATGCTNNSISITITQPSAGITVTGTVNNILCHGLNNGAIQINVSGGTPGYSYLWNNGATTEDINNLSPGNYSLVVTDANGCTHSTYAATILQPNTSLTVNGTVINPACNGNANGSIDATASGGTPPYMFNWSNGMDSEDIWNLLSGNYQVTVTDANGCSTTGSFNVIDPAILMIQASVTPSTCANTMDASIGLTVTGGAAPYNYQWNNGSSQSFLNSISAGNYSVTVTDASGCTTSASYVVPPTSALTVSVTTDSILSIWLGETVDLEAYASGGVGNLTYEWNPPAGLTCTNCYNPSASPTINSQYGVVVTDENGCTAFDAVYIEIMFAMYVPNTFTPNGDGDNDQFFAVSESVKKFNMRIFDRWGEEVFTTTSIYEGWDGFFKGLEAKQDVYVYRIEATFINGKYQEIIGQVNLIR